MIRVLLFLLLLGGIVWFLGWVSYSLWLEREYAHSKKKVSPLKPSKVTYRLDDQYSVNGNKYTFRGKTLPIDDVKTAFVQSLYTMGGLTPDDRYALGDAVEDKFYVVVQTHDITLVGLLPMSKYEQGEEYVAKIRQARNLALLGK